MRDSVIQRFEFTYELAWNMLKERLDQEGIAVRTPRETWQQALLAGMIVDGNRWSDMQKLRNLTSHTYDETLADQVYGVITSEGLELFRQLAEKGGAHGRRTLDLRTGETPLSGSGPCL